MLSSFWGSLFFKATPKLSKQEGEQGEERRRGRKESREERRERGREEEDREGGGGREDDRAVGEQEAGRLLISVKLEVSNYFDFELNYCFFKIIFYYFILELNPMGIKFTFI